MGFERPDEHVLEFRYEKVRGAGKKESGSGEEDTTATATPSEFVEVRGFNDKLVLDVSASGDKQMYNNGEPLTDEQRNNPQFMA